MLIGGGRDHVRTLRAIGGKPDALALRRTLERAVGRASLRPRGLPSRAIVCVRRVRVGAAGLDGIEWPARLERHMERVVARAVYPFLNTVPADAGAVAFRDEAELLACLMRDARSGNGSAWWWRGLFGDTAHESLVQRALLESPTFVPAAIALLADRGLAEEVVGGWSPPFCERLAAAVRRVFGLDRAPTPPAPEARAARAVTGAMYSAVSREVRAFNAALAGVTGATALTTLVGERRDLLVLALVLARAPRLARTSDLHMLLQQWIDAEPPSARASHARAMSNASPTASLEPAHQTVTPDGFARGETSADASTDIVTRLASRHEAISAPITPARDDVAPEAIASPPPTESLDDVVSPVQGEAMPAVVAAPSRDPATAVPSDYAGVFYLVNVALHLELYGDFANPLRPGLSLAFGDFLALIGAHVCGPAVRHDALWAILATLAGRDAREEPGLDVVPAEEFVAITNRMATRTAQALGMAPDAALGFLCRRPGHIAMTDTRLDVHFPLATHPLDIRIAGLDRNPGWVPAAGRIIEFHYA